MLKVQVELSDRAVLEVLMDSIESLLLKSIKEFSNFDA